MGHYMHEHKHGYLVGFSLLWFILAFLVVYFLLVSYRPDYVRRKDSNGVATDELDYTTITVISLLIALGVALVLAALRYYSWQC